MAYLTKFKIFLDFFASSYFPYCFGLDNRRIIFLWEAVQSQQELNPLQGRNSLLQLLCDH